ncbi:hypothetical protein GCHA_0859 [Paraglaciecola chathamensis S18K6]|uniref:Uncharacterized protein n=1 Tax=Paraglaciecola chathamensis S18K6 TaxID=1127672 RepID=A0AAV3UUL5_9ALTE|nr:hypothetical protein GCHA_0859 [Paraglaciecola chathamensis S18K6]
MFCDSSSKVSTISWPFRLPSIRYGEQALAAMKKPRHNTCQLTIE